MDDPHYTDRRFDGGKALVVYGKETVGGKADYSDRIWQWNPVKAERAAKTATESGARPHTCRWYEAYLSAFMEKPITITCIKAGVNVSSGYSYLLFFYN